MPTDEVMARQEEFLEAFVNAKGNAETAREVTKTPRSTFFKWLRDDEVFRTRFDENRILLAVDIEDEAIKRVLDPEGKRGSDVLATTLLKGLKRDRYGEDDKSAKAVQVVYISGLRDTPRPGVEDAKVLEPATDVAVLPAVVPE